MYSCQLHFYSDILTSVQGNPTPPGALSAKRTTKKTSSKAGDDDDDDGFRAFYQQAMRLILTHGAGRSIGPATLHCLDGSPRILFLVFLFLLRYYGLLLMNSNVIRVQLKGEADGGQRRLTEMLPLGKF